MKSPRWIVRFRRTLALEIDTSRVVREVGGQKFFAERWTYRQPVERTQFGTEVKTYARIRYWHGDGWTIKYDRAYRYKSLEAAEAAAFRQTIQSPELIGELVVERWTAVAKPKSR